MILSKRSGIDDTQNHLSKLIYKQGYVFILRISQNTVYEYLLDTGDTN